MFSPKNEVNKRIRKLTNNPSELKDELATDPEFFKELDKTKILELGSVNIECCEALINFFESTPRQTELTFLLRDFLRQLKHAPLCHSPHTPS